MKEFNKNMRVFDQEKINELKEYDLKKGRLLPDKITTTIPGVPAVSVGEKVQLLLDEGKVVDQIGDTFYEITSASDIGRTLRAIRETPAIESREEVEEIAIYVPYTEEELIINSERDYKSMIESMIRDRYSLNDELAILRQRDSKPEEFKEYNAYVEECKAAAKAEYSYMTE